MQSPAVNEFQQLVSRIEDHIQNFSEMRKGLFYLGGAIEAIDYDRPNKIARLTNFQNLHKEELLKLINLVGERCLGFKDKGVARGLYEKAMYHFNMSLENAELDKDENAYYIISGYSFVSNTMRDLIKLSSAEEAAYKENEQREANDHEIKLSSAEEAAYKENEQREANDHE